MAMNTDLNRVCLQVSQTKFLGPGLCGSRFSVSGDDMVPSRVIMAGRYVLSPSGAVRLVLDILSVRDRCPCNRFFLKDVVKS